MRRSISLCVLCVSYLVAAVPARAATLTVCASGCGYSDIQPAIDAAHYGDTILLRAGQTFIGHYKLRAKLGTGWITIRSDASDSQLPPAGTRLIPSDRPGGNTPTSLLPRILGKGGTLKTTPVLRTEPGAHGYRIQYVELDGTAQLGYETLIYLGDDTAAATAYDLALEHVYIGQGVEAPAHDWIILGEIQCSSPADEPLMGRIVDVLRFVLQRSHPLHPLVRGKC